MDTIWNPLRALLGVFAVFLVIAAAQPSKASTSADLCDPVLGLQIEQCGAAVAAAEGKHHHQIIMSDCRAGLASGTCAGHGVTSCAGPASAVMGVPAAFDIHVGTSQIALCGKSTLTSHTIKLDPPPPRI